MYRYLIEAVLSFPFRLAFSADCNELWALSTDRCLERYELKDGQLVQQVSWEGDSWGVETLCAAPCMAAPGHCTTRLPPFLTSFKLLCTR